MTWHPMTDQHAIERVRIVLILGSPVPPKKARSLGADLDKRREDLGFSPTALQLGPSMSIMFQITPNGPIAVQQPQEANGWDFRRLSAEGASLEVLQLNEANLIYETVEYARWPIFLERFLDVAGPLLDELMTLDEVASLALEYYDRFWFEGPTEAALPSQFLRAVQGTMPKSVTDDGELWHLHRGWFEAGERGRLLIQQNLDAQDETTPSGVRRIVRVMTRAEARKGFWTIAEGDLRPHLEAMHQRTNDVFAAALTDEMNRRVGITSTRT